MRSIKFLLIVFIQILIAGCAGVGVVETSDPLTKLNDAEHLFQNQDRPLIAERLIREATAIYDERQDFLGLGHAHREYADLLLSPSVVKWQKFYQENGFQDRTITYENRAEKAKEYYKKAFEYYSQAESKLKAEADYASLTNLYFNMAWASFQLEETSRACEYYESTYNSYNSNITNNPDAKPYIPSGYTSFRALIDAQRNRVGCEGGI